jgi:hypothetical protein
VLVSVEVPPELTLESAILMAIEAGLSQVWTALPGRVTAWDSTTQRATVQPTVSDVEPTRVLPSVVCPIGFPRSGGYVLTLPVSEGDTGLLVFSTLSMAGWLRSGNEGAPLDTRKHTLSSAVFFPGVSPSPLEDYPDDVPVLGSIQNLGTTSPIAMAVRVNAIVTAIDNAIQAGLAAPSPAAQFAAFASSWNTFKALPLTSLDTGTDDASVTYTPF